jgi:response regulator of citrate/malate metabolism|uniref:NET domain-containing protein n=1 Tax=viral metagenome TaxID=1070528 RepID=A0A6C0E7H3_9ZZZZ
MSDSEDNKCKNLDTFFDIKKEDSPKDKEDVKFDYKNIGEKFQMDWEYQEIIEQAKGLSKTEHLEIFKIIENNDDNYTVNDNGVFVALNKIKPDTLESIKNSINFYLANRERLQIDQVERNSIREIMNCQNQEKSNVKVFNKIFRQPEKN